MVSGKSSQHGWLLDDFQHKQSDRRPSPTQQTQTLSSKFLHFAWQPEATASVSGHTYINNIICVFIKFWSIPFVWLPLFYPAYHLSIHLFESVLVPLNLYFPFMLSVSSPSPFPVLFQSSSLLMSQFSPASSPVFSSYPSLPSLSPPNSYLTPSL